MFERIDMKKGASSALYFLGSVWLMILALVFFLEGFNAYSKAGKTQTFADLISDGSCFVADNGWGVDEKVAKRAKNVLVSLNKDEFEKKGIKLRSYPHKTKGQSDKDFSLFITDDKGKPTSSRKYMDDGANKNNTVGATAGMESKTLTTNLQISAEDRVSWTRLNYSGGLRIVREAWTHTYIYHVKHGGKQTPYVWGGGHGDGSLGCFETGADCSGFVSAVFRKCGYGNIVGTSTTVGLESCGRLIAQGSGAGVFESARPGDIILYWSDAGGVSTHVAIYAGKYKGQHWEIHSTSGSLQPSSLRTYQNPGYGPRDGAILAPITYHMNKPKIQIRRIVDTLGRGNGGQDVRTPSYGKYTGDQATVITALLEAGYSKKSTAAICGNWMVESGINPKMREDKAGDLVACERYANRIKNSVYGRNRKSYRPYGEDGGYGKSDFVMEGLGKMKNHAYTEGYGLGQWTTVNLDAPFEDRKAKLWDHAVGMGSDVTDVWVQITYALDEMNQRGLSSNSKFGKGNHKNVDALTEQFLLDFEGVNIALEERQTEANKVLAAIG